ncbi:SCAN domain-containing protein 3 [Nephila pilipes]|uniref:SCAN domain-containing protein 3 n=1 Tax=Nephila pilipes TaxID=299642 RepID=A0A8X6UPQ7_NEPPI|nr:SCAN domain-containing protein 3 [Nephila pilipes]
MRETFLGAFSLLLLWITNMLQMICFWDMTYMCYSVGYILLLEHGKILQKRDAFTKVDACVATDDIEAFYHGIERENLIKPSISAFLKTVLEKDDKNVTVLPLSNYNVSRRIDEVSEDIEKQLVEKLKTKNFSVQMDESTSRDSEAVLITFKKYIDEDGAPNIMGKKKGSLKLMKDANPEMIIIHCVIHKENLVAKNISPVLNEVLHAVIKCVNTIKASAKCERLFKLFCEEQNEDHVRLLLHTEAHSALSNILLDNSNTTIWIIENTYPHAWLSVWSYGTWSDNGYISPLPVSLRGS